MTQNNDVRGAFQIVNRLLDGGYDSNTPEFQAAWAAFEAVAAKPSWPSPDEVDAAITDELERTCPNCGDVVPVGFTLDDHLDCNWPEDFEQEA